MLLANSSNRKPKELHDHTLHAQLYERALGLFQAIPNDKINSAQSPDAIVDALYKRDPLLVVTSLFNNFYSLLATKRGVNKTYKYFDFRFSTSVSRYSSHPKSATLPDSNIALMLLYNSVVSDSQRVPILSAAASKASNSADSNIFDGFIKLVTYESVACVI